LESQRGIVTKSTGSWYKVVTDKGEVFDCRLKGKLKLEGSKSTNPIAVGDFVQFETDKSNENATITKVEPRRNFLVRKAANLSRQTHVIAANIDYTVIIATLKKPRISTSFIDRFIVISEAYNIKPLILFNKTDIYHDKELEYLSYLIDLYRALGYPCLAVSAKTLHNIDNFKALILNNTSLFAGQSGVGKSTLLNNLLPGLNLKTKEISSYSNKGKHSTSHYEMYPIDNKTYVIDSPGIKELGLHDFEAFEISLFFPEMKKYAGECKFNTCLHRFEPGCAIKKAVEIGEIMEERYLNYLKILEDFNT